MKASPECKKCGLLKSTVDTTFKTCLRFGDHDFGRLKPKKLPSRPKTKMEEFEELAHALYETHQDYWDAIELAKDFFSKGFK